MEKEYVIKESPIKVAKFISKKYKEKFNKNISPIKIQKALYFLYAFWAKDILKNTEDYNSEMNEYFSQYSGKELFKVSFYAWTYGPVVKEIRDSDKYLIKDDNEFVSLKALEDDELLNDWFNSKLESILITNDFVLVDISHRDSAWKEARQISHDEKMNNENIINEYKNK